MLILFRLARNGAQSTLCMPSEPCLPAGREDETQVNTSGLAPRNLYSFYFFGEMAVFLKTASADFYTAAFRQSRPLEIGITAFVAGGIEFSSPDPV